MKAASAGLIAYLGANNAFVIADLYTLTAIDGAVYRWTAGDTNLTESARVFSCSGPTIKRGSTRQAAGGEVGTLELTLGGAGVTLGTRTLSEAAAEGYFDGAVVTIERLFMPTWGDVSLGTLPWFSGQVASVNASSNEVRLSLKEAGERLNLPMPRHTFQPACSHSLYDAGCGVLRATYKTNGTMTGVPTVSSFTSLNAQATGYYVGGTVKFTSGPNAGVSRIITTHTASGGTGTFGVGIPLLYAPAAGNTVEFTPGCNKAYINTNGTPGDCVARFNNATRFRGFPYVPKPESVR
jgi:uncharacterized phage protein (TIGR02218 family)